LIRASSEKQATQHCENLRKNSLGNYKSAKAGENRDQANQGVNDGVDLQYRIIAPSVSC
jgi:hypothetical protein